MSDVIILETPRLVLTMWDKGDAEIIRQLHSTIDTTRYLSGAAPWTLEKAEERLEKLVWRAGARWHDQIQDVAPR